MKIIQTDDVRDWIERAGSLSEIRRSIGRLPPDPEYLERAFGIYAVRELGIESAGRKPSVRYGLRIDRDRIRVVI